jgi:tryptophan synthase alpha chain
VSGRIARTFHALRSDGRSGLVAFVTGGDPDMARSATVLQAVDAGGADVIEVGVPFSDPLADGPVIQRASERALAAGASLGGVLHMVGRLRGSIRAPIVLFSYANPVLRFGLTPFARAAAKAGVDGVLLVDVPLEEATPSHAAFCDAGLDPIYLVSPTTSDERLRDAARLGRGFLYAISRLGVTGVRDSVEADARALVGRVHAVSSLPVAVGFGLSTPEHVRDAGTWADAAVVGSALVAEIAARRDDPALGDRVTEFVRWLKNGDART